MYGMDAVLRPFDDIKKLVSVNLDSIICMYIVHVDSRSGMPHTTYMYDNI